MKQSDFLSINWRNFLQGLLIAALTPVFVIVQQSFEKGEFVFEWKTLLLSAIGGGIAYLTKKFFQKPDQEIQRIGTPNVPKKN